MLAHSPARLPVLLALSFASLCAVVAAGEPPPTARAEAERLLASGRPAAAERIFRQLFEAEEGDAAAAVGWVRAVAAQGRTAEAAALGRSLASSAEAASDLEAARALLGLVVELEPADPAARGDLGRVLALTRRHASAVVELRRAVELGRADLETLFYLGSSLWENGEIEAARRTFETALDRFGRRAVILAQLGRLMLWSGEHAEAVDALEEALRLDPDDPLVAIDLARALEAVGETERALEACRLAVAKAPEHAEMRYVLARLLRRAGETEAAERELAVYRRLYREEQERTRGGGLERAVLDRGEVGSRRDEAPAAVRQVTARWAPSAGSVVELVEVASRVGLDFVHDRGTTEARHLPETMGAGLSWLDYDGDGWPDLYVVQSGTFPPGPEPRAPDALFRNRGDGTFEEVGERAGASRRGTGQGSLAADLDGDGDVDLFLTNFGRDVVLLNDGLGRLEDSTEALGLAIDGWSSSAAAADADGDGDLDLYVSRYVEYDPDHGLFCGDAETGERKYCDPSLFVGAEDRFLRNVGGTFVEAAAEAGIAPADGRGLGVVFADLDDDRDPDLYVANDLTLNFLFANRGDGTFDDLTLVSGTAVDRQGRPEAGMGVAVGDVDGDLAPDLAVTNFDVETNTLYRNLGGLAFEDVAARSGFGVPSFNRLAFGIAALDLDLDGDLDYYLANGHIFERPARENVAYAQTDQILLGDGTGRFRELAEASSELRPTVARGLAAGDFDRDGDVDLAVQENGGPLALLRNDKRSAAWLGVLLRGDGANTAAVGSTVTLEAEAGAERRWVLAGDSYQSSGDPAISFHRPAGAAPRRLRVRWPIDGALELRRPPSGRYLVIPQRARSDSTATSAAAGELD